MLKALTTEPGQLVAPIPGTVRYDLHTISMRVSAAQYQDAIDEVNPPFVEDLTPLQREKYETVMKRQHKLGLPDPNDPERLSKMEAILHEMTDDGLLGFHSPNMWVVKG